MKRTLLFKASVALALILSAAGSKAATFEKTIHKSWGIEKVKSLSVDNKFGNINFVSSRTDSVVVDIQVKIEDRKAEFLAEQLEFVLYLSDGNIVAKTKFGDKFKTNDDFEIIYNINIPIDRDLEVENKYGNVNLGDLNAHGKFEIHYGNIQANNLNTPDETPILVELKYGNASLLNVNKLSSDIGYSNITLGDVEDLIIDSKYSILKMGKIQSLKADSKYDNVKIKSVGELGADSKYTQWDISELSNKLFMENQYGDINIDHVADDFSSIKIENSYANIQIGMSETASYQLKAECYYCKIKNNEGEVIKDINERNKHYKRVDIGNNPADAYVDIESRYGNIKLVK